MILNTDIALDDVLALDRVQKNLPIEDNVLKRLRKQKLVEGRKPNVHVSSNIASATGTEADYIRSRGQQDTHYKKMIVDYLKEFQPASREQIDKLLFDLLSSRLSEVQKKSKISRLLTALKKDRMIENTGTRNAPSWQLSGKKNQG